MTTSFFFLDIVTNGVSDSCTLGGVVVSHTWSHGGTVKPDVTLLLLLQSHPEPVQVVFKAKEQNAVCFSCVLLY